MSMLRPASSSNSWAIAAAVCILTLVPAATVLSQEGSAKKMEAYAEKLSGELKIEMVPIPAGQKGYPKTFKMGSPEDEADRAGDEGPQVEVEIEPFWMGKFEITWDIYDAFRREYSNYVDTRLVKDQTPAAAWADAVSLPTPLWEQDSAPILQGLGTKGGFPVADISQFAAKQFTKWLSRKTGHFYRLPTEAEWEYAARAGTQTPYFFGDDTEKLEDFAWFFDNSGYDDPEFGYPGAGAGYRKVGLKKPNPWGLHDIYGNVSEWVVDAHSKDGYKRLAGKKVRAADAVLWPKEIFNCVVRGGNWESDPSGCRSASRLISEPKWQYRDPQIPKSIWWYTDAFHVGFRIVRPAVEPSEAEKQRYWESAALGIQEVMAEGGKQVRVPIGKKAK